MFFLIRKLIQGENSKVDDMKLKEMVLRHLV